MTARRATRILMAAGGTGGHVYPALAIADAVRALDPGAVIEFAGTNRRMEWDAVPKGGYAIHAIEAAGFDRRRLIANLGVPFKVLRGLVQAWRLVGDFDADVVVATGGFVTGPMGLAAAARRRPLLIQEQNAYAGVTNRWLSRFASRIHVAFSEAMAAFGADRVVLSGNPVRANIAGAPRDEARRFFQLPDDARVLFVFGGSLGSQALNQALEKRVTELMVRPEVHVLWQTGARYFDRIQASVGSMSRVHVLRYVDRMDLAYAAADVVLGRSGAITCSELLMTGTPSILVPSPNVAEDHQAHNAASLERLGAARMLPESRLESDWVSAVLDLLTDSESQARMREAALKHAPAGVAERIARDVLELAGARRS